ncbi:hypothetical protein [Streptomyces griseocarneus]|uniref:hypothetical protein n=1 Tax=Streptomyces griseocarneus TaxID=51201 RepID=UPI00167D47B8|nr:hypothetical protein [Streptomyces griseocarneus]MBZ6475882.1 hypothetical protein [Streptomyces griseocarneus]
MKWAESCGTGPYAKVCKEADKVSDGVNKAAEVAKDPAGTLATAAFDAVAGRFGKAATGILHDLTDAFLVVSTVDLRKSEYLLDVYSITWAISSLVALFLLIGQFAKVGLSGEGRAAATAITGLAKWAVVTLASLAVTQAALGATNAASKWMIDQYRDGGGEKAFKETMDKAFLFDSSTNSALVLLLGILAALVTLVLWGEMLLRAAAIQVLVACMPIVSAGGIMEATKEWWPKARNALIALIVMKPVIVLIFLVGFSATGSSKNLNDFLTGLLTLFLAAVAWPSIAKFMTFTSVGSGGSLASGLLSAAGGAAASMFGSGGGSPAGAGAIGGGRDFTRAVEAENDGAVAQGGAAGRAQGGRAASMGVLGAAGMAMQVAKAGKELAEGGMEAMAAHADLGPGKDMGGQVVLPPGTGGSGAGSPHGDDGGAGASPPPPAPPAATGGAAAGLPSSGAAPQDGSGSAPPMAVPPERGDAPTAVASSGEPSATSKVTATRAPLMPPPAPAQGSDQVGGTQ